MTDGATCYGLPAPPLVTFAEAEGLGEELRARWAMMAGAEPPLEPGDYAWADIVQFILRRASEVAHNREKVCG